MRSPPPGMARQPRVASPIGMAECQPQRGPMGVHLARQRQPLLDSSAPVEALGRGPRAAVALAVHRSAIGGVLDDLLGGGVQRPFDHGSLDEATGARVVAFGERDQRGKRCVHAGQRIARSLGDARLVVGVAGVIGAVIDRVKRHA